MHLRKVFLQFLFSIGIVFLCWVFLQKDFSSFCKKELSFSFISKLFYGNIYEQSVSATSTMDVMNYEINEDTVTVWLPSNTLYLPFSGICTKKTNDSLVVEVDNTIFEIVNVEKVHLKIYETFYPNKAIAEVDNFVKFKVSEPEVLVSKFYIVHDKV